MSNDLRHSRDDRGRVIVIPLGPVDQVAVRVAAANIQAVLDLPTDLADPWPVPDYALIPSRKQYNAVPIIAELIRGFDRPVLRVGLTHQDLCLPFLTHVFGEAQVGGLAAVVSLFRLAREKSGIIPPRAQVYERLSKVLLHEIGHLLNLSHCRNRQCLMSFSLGLEQLDRLSLTFCSVCENLLQVRSRLPFPIG